MKQATNKLFRGCPYKDVNFETCNECPNYKRCVEKKKARRMKKVQRLLNMTLPIIMTIATIIVAIAAIIMCTSLQGNHQDETIPTTVPTTESSYVVVDLGVRKNKEASIEVISPTEEVIKEEEDVIEVTTEVQEVKISADGPSDSWYYFLSEEDMILIAKLVWAEARGESFEGKVGVAAVVLNRYCYGNDCDFDRESIESVITQRCQFASIKSVSMDDLNKVPECIEAVEAACKGWDPTRSVFEDGALYFYAPKGVKGYEKQIREGIEVMTIGNHNFHYNFEKVV